MIKMFPAIRKKKKIKIMTPNGEVDNIRVAPHSGVVYFCKDDENGLVDTYTLGQCEIVIVEDED